MKETEYFKDEELKYQVLSFLKKNGCLTQGEIVEKLADYFHIPQDEREKSYSERPNDKIFYKTVASNEQRLKAAGLEEFTELGHSITERGLKALMENESTITYDYLRKFIEYRQWESQWHKKRPNNMEIGSQSSSQEWCEYILREGNIDSHYIIIGTEKAKLFNLNADITLLCTDGSHYDGLKLNENGRFYATEFFNGHHLNSGDILEIQLHPENNTIITHINQPIPENIEEEIIPKEEKTVTDFLSRHLQNIEKGLQPYKGNGREIRIENQPIDLLCVAENGDFVVIEVKLNHKNDEVVGQILRYMGLVKSNLAKDGQNVRGIIVMRKPLEITKDLKNLKHALSCTDNIELKFYKMSISLEPESEQ